MSYMSIYFYIKDNKKNIYNTQHNEGPQARPQVPPVREVIYTFQLVCLECKC